MNKVSGKISDFNLLSEDASRIVIGYGLTKVNKTLYEWQEVYIYKSQKNLVGFAEVKEAILKDINEATDEKILSGFKWTPEGGSAISVYLSNENQRNFSEAQRMASANAAILPLTFKLGEDEEGKPVYQTFESAEELNSFYLSAFAYINQCLNEGWQKKDSINWSEYEALYPQPEESNAGE